MTITIDEINRAVGKPLTGQPLSNAMSVVVALGRYGAKTGLDLPHREAQFLGQLAHESMGFVYDKEVWGPTEAQKRYDTRTDLGNTAAVDGDGFLYRGRGPIQTTGKANYAAFRDWVRKTIDPGCPDFVAQPDLLNTDPWEGLSAIWYWSTRTRNGKSMNAYADAGDTETITKIINGGTNGLADRFNWFTRFGLVKLGFAPTDVRGFQTAAGLAVDGDAGPKTRGAIHERLKALATSAPVIETPSLSSEPPVAPPALQKTIEQRVANLEAVVGSILARAPAA